MANSNAHSCGGHGDPTTADQWMHATKDVIGEGATSVVYRCRFGGDGHYVAIKSPSSPAARRSATSPKACDEFRRSRRLHHNNVVGYLALGCQGNLVMEFIDGGSLADVIARSGALPEERVEQIAKHVLLGLAYMHENGIVHRDVKPANILVDTCTDTFKLCDWIVEEEASNCVNSDGNARIFGARGRALWAALLQLRHVGAGMHGAKYRYRHSAMVERRQCICRHVQDGQRSRPPTSQRPQPPAP